MATKRREGGCGSPVKNERKKCWLAPSRLMGGRNGYVNSVVNPLCGRGGVAGDAAGKTQAGDCGENWQGVHGLFDVEWRGGQEV